MRTALLVFAVAAFAAPSPKVYGPKAVWAPLMGVNAALHDVCGGDKGDPLGLCLRRFMKDAKASKAAVAFSEKLEQGGYLREFIAAGKIDLGRVHFPFRANFNDTVYFLNGTPPLVDAYGPAALQPIDLKRPGAFLVPDGFSLPKRVPAFSGVRFTASMPARACRACENLAVAEVAYDFTDAGVFKGATLLTLKDVAPASK